MTAPLSLASRLRDGLWSGRPLPDVRIVDAHGHLGPWPQTWVHNCDPASLVAAMDRTGVALACLGHFAGLGSNIQYGNDQTAAAAAAFPGRLIGYAVVNPNDPGEPRRELERCIGKGIYVGPKLHTVHGPTASHPGYESMWEYADAHRLIALIHGSSPDEIDALSSRWENMTFLIAHGAAGVLPPDDPYLALYRERPNVYADTAGSQVIPGALDRLVELAGPHKILFGSDFPLMDLACQLGRPLWSQLDDDSLQLILGGNFLRLLTGIPSLRLEASPESD